MFIISKLVASMKILLYTFYNWNNLTYKILRSKEFNKYRKLYITGRNGVNRLVKNFIKNKYDLVLGFGDFNKRAKRIRIETRFINKYGIRKIVNNAPEFYRATLKLLLKTQTYRSDKISNGPCNRSAFLLIHNAKVNNISTKISFVHIPSSFDIDKAKYIVLSWLNELNKV